MTNRSRYFSILALISVLVSATPLFAESRYFTVQTESIEVMVVDPATGELSKDILDRKGSGLPNQTVYSRSRRDDLFLRIRFIAKGDGNIQPPISVAVLSDIDAVEEPFADVLFWRTIWQEDFFDQNGRGTVTALLRNASCFRLLIVAKIGADEEGATTAVLPFQCNR